jgi:hypothetical protein
MDTTALMLSVLFGVVGMGFLMYGKKAGRPIPIIAGLALMVLPYFISSVLILLIVCAVVTATPFVVHE